MAGPPDEDIEALAELGFVGGLVERDLRNLSKNRNVSSAIAAKARRIILEREKRGR